MHLASESDPEFKRSTQVRFVFRTRCHTSLNRFQVGAPAKREIDESVVPRVMVKLRLICSQVQSTHMYTPPIHNYLNRTDLADSDTETSG